MSQPLPPPTDDVRVTSGPPRRADHAVLVDLWVASWRETMPDIDFDARRGFIDAALHAPGHRLFVVRLGDRPVGFALVEAAHLHQLVVAPSLKGRGVATALLDAVKAQAPVGLTLDVNQANARAMRFYEREGFVFVGSGANPASGLATWALRWTP